MIIIMENEKVEGLIWSVNFDRSITVGRKKNPIQFEGTVRARRRGEKKKTEYEMPKPKLLWRKGYSGTFNFWPIICFVYCFWFWFWFWKLLFRHPTFAIDGIRYYFPHKTSSFFVIIAPFHLQQNSWRQSTMKLTHTLYKKMRDGISRMVGKNIRGFISKVVWLLSNHNQSHHISEKTCPVVDSIFNNLTKLSMKTTETRVKPSLVRLGEMFAWNLQLSDLWSKMFEIYLCLDIDIDVSINEKTSEIEEKKEEEGNSQRKLGERTKNRVWGKCGSERERPG